MAKSDQLLQTIETIHSAGLDARRWPDALEAIMQSVGGIAATIEVYDRRSAALTDFRSFGLPQPNEIAYSDHYFASNPRIPHLMNRRIGGIITDYMVMGEKDMDGDEFYADFLAPTGYRYFVGGTMNASALRSVLLSVQRSTKQGHVDTAEVTQMRRLLPHVRQAFEVTQRLEEAADAERSLKQVFDMLSDGIALVGPAGMIFYANEALQSIFRQNDGLGFARSGTLEFSDPVHRRKYERALTAARRIRSGEIRSMDDAEFSVPRPSRAPSYIISVSPVFGSTRKSGKGKYADAIIFIRDPLQQNRSDIGLLCDVFGFTVTEAHVAQALQAAIPLNDYAKAHGVSINTVYSHLRSIKDKTQCRRQGELVRTLNGIAMPLRRN